MKKTLLFAALLLAIATSCTHNDGDIGPLFGIWRLEKMTRDGQAVDLRADGLQLVTFAFQNQVVEINTTEDHNYLTTCLANWRRDGQTLTFDFDNTDATGEDVRYTPPSILGWRHGETCPTEIVKLDGKNMELAYVSPTGGDYRYWLKKTK